MGDTIPDILARVVFFTLEQGNTVKPIPPEQFGCPLIHDGKAFECRLMFDQVGRGAVPGDTVFVPIKFIWPEGVRGRIKKNDTFTLWSGGNFAEGQVTAVYQ